MRSPARRYALHSLDLAGACATSAIGVFSRVARLARAIINGNRPSHESSRVIDKPSWVIDRRFRFTGYATHDRSSSRPVTLNDILAEYLADSTPKPRIFYNSSSEICIRNQLRPLMGFVLEATSIIQGLFNILLKFVFATYHILCNTQQLICSLYVGHKGSFRMMLRLRLGTVMFRTSFLAANSLGEISFFRRPLAVLRGSNVPYEYLPNHPCSLRERFSS
jgi:hypothetical protein